MDAADELRLATISHDSTFAPCVDIDPSALPAGHSPLLTVLRRYPDAGLWAKTAGHLAHLIEQRHRPGAWVFSIPDAVRDAVGAGWTELLARYAGWTAHAAGHTGPVDVWMVPVVDGRQRFVAVPRSVDELLPES